MTTTIPPPSWKKRRSVKPKFREAAMAFVLGYFYDQDNLMRKPAYKLSFSDGLLVSFEPDYSNAKNLCLSCKQLEEFGISIPNRARQIMESYKQSKEETDGE